MARNPRSVETAPPRQGPALPLPPQSGGIPRRPRTTSLPTASLAALEKKNQLWIWLAFDRFGQRLIDWECGNRDAATLNRLLERLTTSSAGAQAQRSKTLERHAVLYRRLWALPHAPAGWAALHRQG